MKENDMIHRAWKEYVRPKKNKFLNNQMCQKNSNTTKRQQEKKEMTNQIYQAAKKDG